MLELIDSAYDRLSPELQKAARWVRAQPAELAVRSMRECARRAGVAPATMTRLAQALGLDGFEALREPLRSALAAGYSERARSLQAGAGRRGGAPSEPSWREELARHQQQAVESAGANRQASLNAAARALLGAGTAAFLGLRACRGLALQLHYSYGLLAGNGLLLDDADETLQDQLDALGRGDLLVALSVAPYTRRTVESVQAAAARGIPVLALTDDALSPLARAAQRSLIARSDSPSYFQTLAGVLALAEQLCAAVAITGGREVIEHLEARQRRLAERGAYWRADARPRRPPESPKS